MIKILENGLGDMLKKARVDKKITYREVERREGFDFRTIKRMEATPIKYSFERLQTLARAVGGDLSIQIMDSKFGDGK